MATYVAVAIGVANASGLPKLPGAVNGAEEFRDWAQQQGYETHLITDENGPVTVQSLKAVIDSILQNGDAERLIIYFAGHGIEPVTNSAYWLLSNWEADSNEAVNFNLSFSNAKRSGIRQIAVFADACRSTVRDAASVGGGSIFPKSTISAIKIPQWDQFLASRLGEQAQEVRGADPTKAFGVFTRCLMSALRGEADQAIENRPPSVVPSEALANFLEDAVPLESGKIPGASVQFPDATSGWRRPADVYAELAAPPPGCAASLPDIAGFRRSADRMSEAGELAAARAETLANSAVAEAVSLNQEAVEKREQLFTARRGRKGFETGQGLTIIGGTLVRIACRRGQDAELVMEDGVPSVRVFGDSPQPIVFELDNGNWVGTCSLPEFVATIVIDGGTAASLIYAPALYRRFPQEPFDRIAPALSRWTALMHQGRLPTMKDLEEAGAILRGYQHTNPSFGILAAYAYERAGNIAAIDRIMQHFHEDRQPVPFDVALLSGKRIEQAGPRLVIETSAQHVPVAGSFPLMTQGWSFLDSEEYPRLLALRPGLLASLWTTMRAAGGARLAELVFQGEI